MRRVPILLGALAQAAVFAALLVVVRPPAAVYAVAPATAGAVAAVTRDSDSSLVTDATWAGIAGTVLSLIAAGVGVWGNLAGVPLTPRVDLTFLMVTFGLGVFVLLFPVVVLLSVVAGHLTVAFRGRLTAR